MPRLLFRILFGLLLIAAGPAHADIDRIVDQAEREGAEAALRTLLSVVPPAGPAACMDRGGTRRSHQLVRLHTQLMVAGLACADVYGEPDLFRQYRVFSTDNANLLRQARADVEAEFGGGEGGTQQFDTYRTRLANEEALIIVDRSLTTYCRMRESRFRHLIDSTAEGFSSYADAVAARARVRQSGC